MRRDRDAGRIGDAGPLIIARDQFHEKHAPDYYSTKVVNEGIVGNTIRFLSKNHTGYYTPYCARYSFTLANTSSP